MDVAQGGDSHRRSLAKAGSWRIAGSIDTFIISFVVTGRIALAAPIAATELLTKVVIYYLHERAWAFVRWGRS